MTPPPDARKKDWRDSLPFPARWLFYIAAKIVVLTLILFVALNHYGLI